MFIKHPSKEFIDSLIHGPKPVPKEFRDECIRLARLTKLKLCDGQVEEVEGRWGKDAPPNDAELERERELAEELDRPDFISLCEIVRGLEDRLEHLESEVTKLKNKEAV